MGLSNTAGDSQVALFDNTSMQAFGPVFDDEVEVDSFLDWMNTKEEEGETFILGHQEFYFRADVRVYRSNELDYLVSRFRDEQDENEGRA